MSFCYLTSELEPCTEDQAMYLRIEAYDIQEYTEILLKHGKDFEQCFKNEFCAVYFPPRYLATLRRSKQYLERLQKNKDNEDHGLEISKSKGRPKKTTE